VELRKRGGDLIREANKANWVEMGRKLVTGGARKLVFLEQAGERANEVKVLFRLSDFKNCVN